MNKLSAGLLTVAALAATPALAQIRITEWMYDHSSGEFVEFTNVGNTPVDMTGWWYDDDSRLPGVFSLSGFGVVQPGQSVIITENSAAAFRANWNLPASVQILGGYTNNLGRNDEINLFNDVVLVDRLAYGDQNFPGTIRTQGRSGNTLPANLGNNAPATWTLSTVGDIYGSYANTTGAIGNPGSYIPAPGAAALLGLGALAAGRRRR